MEEMCDEMKAKSAAALEEMLEELRQQQSGEFCPYTNLHIYNLPYAHAVPMILKMKSCGSKRNTKLRKMNVCLPFAVLTFSQLYSN